MSQKPVWNEKRRELSIGNTVVKRFRQPARNQEAILAAFQEENWPFHIDDPLPGGENCAAQDHLHDTVRRLNKQKVRLILFLSDGLGQGVTWEPYQKPAKKKRPRSAPPAPKKRPRSAP